VQLRSQHDRAGRARSRRNPIGDIGRSRSRDGEQKLRRLRLTGCGIGDAGREALVARFGGHAVQL